jgi:hypothetical protein
MQQTSPDSGPQTPGSMENGQKQVASLKSSKNWGDRRPQAGAEKQQHRWEKKGRLNFQTKEKTWNLRGRII